MRMSLSVLVGRLRGRAGDAVASTWMGRQYVRQWVPPKNPKTVPQREWRYLVGRQAKLWRSLPSALRADVNRFGLSKRLTGYNLVCKTCLTNAAQADPWELIPGSAKVLSPHRIVAVPGLVEKNIDVIADLGPMPANGYCHLFSMPVLAYGTGKTEPDVWTYHGPLSAGTLAAGTTIALAQAAEDYYIACISSDKETLSASFYVAGGCATFGSSGG